MSILSVVQQENIVLPDLGDWRPKNELLVCEKCNTRKEMDIEIPELFAESKRIAILCKCESEKYNARYINKEYPQVMHKIACVDKDGYNDSGVNYNRTEYYNKASLSNHKPREMQMEPLINSLIKERPVTNGTDKSQENHEAIKACEQYSSDWKKMFSTNTGLLIMGGSANERSLLLQRISADLRESKASVAEITTQQLPAKDSPELKKLIKRKFFIIDELSVDKNTADALFEIVDMRLSAGKPLIVTTNLTLEAFDKPVSVTQARVYDRIMQMCGLKVELGKTQSSKN